MKIICFTTLKCLLAINIYERTNTQKNKLSNIWIGSLYKALGDVFEKTVLNCRLSLTTFELAFDFIKQLVKLPQLEREMKEYALLTQNQAGSKMNFIL